MSYFTAFKASVDGFNLPEKFTFPFYYQPHPLCILAAQELQEHLKSQQQWQWVNYNLLTLKVIDSYLYYDDRIISTSPPY
jgi:tRNA pseudouridine32 synthase/23S rRNA pseudouridine746 synthase